MRILTTVGYYLPGYRAGGPIRSVSDLVDLLGDEYEFLILTTDRDSGDVMPYPGIRPGSWERVGKALVRYLAPEEMTFSTFRAIVCETAHDVVYLNSFFWRATVWYLLCRRLGLVPDRPTVIAPRGEFSMGALSLGAAKKRLYLSLVKALGLCQGANWHASALHEVEDIRSVFGRLARVQEAGSPGGRLLSDTAAKRDPPSRAPKESGALRVVYLSRIAPMKNLDTAIRLLSRIEGQVIFDIYGPISDQAYWRQCQELVAALPPAVKAEYHGPIPPHLVMDVLAQHHVLLLPTRGENYGHVIREAMSAGCLPVLSDRTPWRGLEDLRVGWDLPLDDEDAFAAALGRALEMSQAEYNEWSAAARSYASTLASERDPSLPDRYRALFSDCADGGRPELEQVNE